MKNVATGRIYNNNGTPLSNKNIMKNAIGTINAMIGNKNSASGIISTSEPFRDFFTDERYNIAGIINVITGTTTNHVGTTIISLLKIQDGFLFRCDPLLHAEN